jgi:hypothetical protein
MKACNIVFCQAREKRSFETANAVATPNIQTTHPTTELSGASFQYHSANVQASYSTADLIVLIISCGAVGLPFLGQTLYRFHLSHG